jgi:hypothetical protein
VDRAKPNANKSPRVAGLGAIWVSLLLSEESPTTVAIQNCTGQFAPSGGPLPDSIARNWTPQIDANFPQSIGAVDLPW